MSLVLTSAGRLAAQTFAPGQGSYPPPATAPASNDQPWRLSSPDPRAYPPPPFQGDVMRAEYQAPVPLAEPRSKTPIKMSPPGRSSHESTGRSVGGWRSLVTIGSSLVIVLGGFSVFVWLLRRSMPASAAPLPSDVVEVLGRTVVAHRQQLQLIRFGGKLLLVSVTPGGAETLAEIDEPDEVTRLAGLCQQTRSGSTTAVFREVLEQLAGGRTHGR